MNLLLAITNNYSLNFISLVIQRVSYKQIKNLKKANYRLKVILKVDEEHE